MSTPRNIYQDGWMDALERMLDELERQGLRSEAIDLIYDYCCDHHRTLEDWHNQGAPGLPPALPPMPMISKSTS